MIKEKDVVKFLFLKRTKKTKSCWNWNTSKVRSGYGLFWIPIELKCSPGKYLQAHRVSWTLFNGRIPKYKQVCHKCDNRLCVRPSHLFLGTHDENMKDKVRKNRQFHPLGELNSCSKLNEAKVKYIREIYNDDDKKIQMKLAKKFKVTPECIRSVYMKRSWKHV